jgi:hypothetical protein
MQLDVLEINERRVHNGSFLGAWVSAPHLLTHSEMPRLGQLIQTSSMRANTRFPPKADMPKLYWRVGSGQS